MALEELVKEIDTIFKYNGFKIYISDKKYWLQQGKKFCPINNLIRKDI